MRVSIPTQNGGEDRLPSEEDCGHLAAVQSSAVCQYSMMADTI